MTSRKTEVEPAPIFPLAPLDKSRDTKNAGRNIKEHARSDERKRCWPVHELLFAETESVNEIETANGLVY
jgi:hypothetical protein